MAERLFALNVMQSTRYIILVGLLLIVVIVMQMLIKGIGVLP